MAKAAKEKTAEKPKNKKDQYERFLKTARTLGVDNQKSAEAFEQTFKRLVPAIRGPGKRGGTSDR